jgi:hypothetical protein
MQGLTRDLVVGIAGSVIGAAVVAIFSFGLRFTKASRESWRQFAEKETLDWRSGDSAKRQHISNSYLFSVLKFFIIGSILTGVSSSIGDLSVVDKTVPLGATDYISASLDIGGVVFYLATFAKILRFTRLLSSYDE